MSVLLLVGGTDDTVVKAKELGITVLLLQHPTKISPIQEAAADVVRHPLVQRIVQAYEAHSPDERT